ncbi:hypothetical protein RRG08_057131 [Elysia crispata]|uniref:Uncharacterized protein n=1 Tax=Elysia crispata TaxID=231223 RepID=A0AAE1CNJ9_9GAST|nr:hypothetical protein RRG08_057131 [Elysia crispata]
MHNTPDVSAANGKPDIVLEYNEANDGVDGQNGKCFHTSCCFSTISQKISSRYLPHHIQARGIGKQNRFAVGATPTFVKNILL